MATEQALDEFQYLGTPVAVPTSRRHKLPSLSDNQCTLRCTSHRDTSTTAEGEQTFVTELAQRKKDGVDVHTQHCCEILGRRQPLARLGLAVRKRPAQFSCHLIAEPDLCVRIDLLDGEHGTIYHSVVSTVLVKEAEPSFASAAAEAIIEEARHRQHRRWLWMAAAVAALVIGLALAVYVGGAASSPDRHPGSSSKGGPGFTGRTTTVEGSFLGIGGLGRAGPLKLSGTVRFVADSGRRTFTARATNGHWKTKLPAGTYSVRGLSKQVNDGRSWGTSTHLVVHAGRTQSNVRVIYGTIR